jgi:hypothetical protein
MAPLCSTPHQGDGPESVVEDRVELRDLLFKWNGLPDIPTCRTIRGIAPVMAARPGAAGMASESSNLVYQRRGSMLKISRISPDLLRSTGGDIPGAMLQPSSVIVES